MTVVLISLQCDMDTIGLKSIHCCLSEKGFESVLLYLPDLDMDETGRMAAVSDFLRSRTPMFVGIGLMSLEYSRAAALTGHLKRTLPGVPVAWGGIHPTMTPETCLDHADYVFAGECERAVVALAETLKNGGNVIDVPNLRYRQNGLMIANPLAPLIEDIDGLPVCGHLPTNAYVLYQNRILPLNRRLFRKHARWNGTVYSIMGSRGCPYACSYCCNSTLTRLYRTRQVRRRSVDGIIAELERAVRDNPEIRVINFQDDCFLSCPEPYLRTFCDAYKRQVNMPFVVRSIPRFLTAEKLRMLKEAGLAWITMGLQSGSDEINRDVFNRQTTSADFLKAATLIHKNRIAAVYDVITDNPFESDAQRLQTVRRIMEIPRPYFLELFSLTFYPGTALYERARRECPGAMEDCLTKDYFKYRKTDVNAMMRMAAYVDSRIMEKLLKYYRYSPKGLKFRLWMILWKRMSAFFFEPVACARVIYLSEGARVLNTLRRLPAYFGQMLNRYTSQF